MDSAELGKRIKEARIAKKMTQSEVVGDFITRNMLSQIESGSATPSIRTLEYLCEVLELPMKQLVTDKAEDELALLTQAKNALTEQKFDRVIQICSTIPKELSDEFWAILSRACMANAKKEAEQGKYKEAAELTERAAYYSQKGIYANDTIKTEAVLFLNQIAEKLSSYYLTKVNELQERKGDNPHESTHR